MMFFKILLIYPTLLIIFITKKPEKSLENINADNIFKLDSECAFTGDINIRNIIWEKSTKVI